MGCTRAVVGGEQREHKVAGEIVFGSRKNRTAFGLHCGICSGTGDFFHSATRESQ